MSHRKRKHRQRSDTHDSQYDQSEGPSLARPDPALFIVAHEADIIRGPQAARTADSLEVFTNVVGNGGSRIGEGLLKWEGNVRGEHGDMWVDRYVRLSYLLNEYPAPVPPVIYYRPTRMHIWLAYPRSPCCVLNHCDPKFAVTIHVVVQLLWYFSSASLWPLTRAPRAHAKSAPYRYDARLLLDALPTVTVSAVPPHAPPDSPGGGWSDLPSDSEDTFFLTPDETADLHRTKRMRHLDALRTARMRALSPAPRLDDDDADPWGGSDEEPDTAQAELMRRTAAHVARATNDAQLRARILAHHGADARFAFLRGRWGRAWARAQADARREILAEREAEGAGVGALGGLTGYGRGSESEGEGEPSGGGGDGGGGSDDGVRVVVAQAAQEPEPEEPAAGVTQEARRAKAREWAQKRRAERAARADNQQRTETSSNLRPSQEPLFSE
ncbi:hypothetical protein EDB92DRAFT_2015019 [Lactarius akahatsu]|uniref:Uncharacterized protein n=1 Tax=Lactarius akahatsu TaxID=416441 RepID=A0AAD4LE05_9AGAM|nr:hypothetical protein EDB92DRAFT_2015019 [Lactarius akahatsu]